MVPRATTVVLGAPERWQQQGNGQALGRPNNAPFLAVAFQPAGAVVTRGPPQVAVPLRQPPLLLQVLSSTTAQRPGSKLSLFGRERPLQCRLGDTNLQKLLDSIGRRSWTTLRIQPGRHAALSKVGCHGASKSENQVNDGSTTGRLQQRLLARPIVESQPEVALKAT